MTALQTYENTPRSEYLYRTEGRIRQSAAEAARAAALERLIRVLEAGTAEAPRPLGRITPQNDALSQLARLRAAHASYVLATTNEVVRISDGVWMTRQKQAA